MNILKNTRFYDKYANIQQAAASSLIKETGPVNISKILEIGCGTGNYTRFLTEKFDKASIVAVDKSKKMVEMARKKLEDKTVEFIVADAEGLELEMKFDLITSNAAFQWFRDFDGAMLNYKNALTANGVISFSIFGPATFRELGRSLKAVLGGHIKIDAADFLKKDEVEITMNRHFKSVTVKEEIVKETFDSLTELLNKIRCTGAWGGIKNILLWKRDALKKTEEAYKSDFGRIEASYQIFFCRGIK